MLVKNYAEICPVASRMVTTTTNIPIEGRTSGKNLDLFAQYIFLYFSSIEIHFLKIVGNPSPCPFKESDGNNATQTATPVVDHDLISLASNNFIYPLSLAR